MVFYPVGRYFIKQLFSAGNLRLFNWANLHTVHCAFCFSDEEKMFYMFFATATTAQETLIQSIVRHHEFFVQLRGYSGYLLNDVEVLERGKSLGVILLSPEGFEEHLVFDVASMRPIYSNARILNKNDRAFLIETSIQMSEVGKLARAAKARAAELRREWQLYKGKPGNIIPRNPPEKKILSHNRPPIRLLKSA